MAPASPSGLIRRSKPSAGTPQQLQQTGMPFIIMQQVQPSFIMVMQHSQQAWIMSQQALSPEVQVMHMPVGSISHLHMPMVRLQVQMARPLSIM
ncbi:MAG: hypothetical protein JO252_03750, partial [Planctomycetaceae bacterium]|nr:hypothetical protein [Planctomycetaceae bacterium]